MTAPEYDTVFAIRNKITGEVKTDKYSVVHSTVGPVKAYLTKKKTRLEQAKRMVKRYPNWMDSVKNLQQEIDESEIVQLERKWVVIAVIPYG